MTPPPPPTIYIHRGVRGQGFKTVGCSGGGEVQRLAPPFRLITVMSCEEKE
jgi:hypothetical protein